MTSICLAYRPRTLSGHLRISDPAIRAAQAWHDLDCMGLLYDGEILGLDHHGFVVIWDSVRHAPFHTPDRLDDYAMGSLSDNEWRRCGLKPKPGSG